MKFCDTSISPYNPIVYYSSKILIFLGLRWKYLFNRFVTEAQLLQLGAFHNHSAPVSPRPSPGCSTHSPIYLPPPIRLAHRLQCTNIHTLNFSFSNRRLSNGGVIYLFVTFNGNVLSCRLKGGKYRRMRQGLRPGGRRRLSWQRINRGDRQGRNS